MAKVQQISEISEITPSFAFIEFDSYKDYEESFKKIELGRIHSLLPLHEMAIRFGLKDSHPRKKAGRKSANKSPPAPNPSAMNGWHAQPFSGKPLINKWIWQKLNG